MKEFWKPVKTGRSYHCELVVECFWGHSVYIDVAKLIDREFVTSAKKFVNFNEFSEIKKIPKNSYINSLNARVGVAFQWNSLLKICYKI